MEIWEIGNEIVVLGDIIDSLPYEQKIITTEKWGMDIHMGARPVIEMFYRHWGMPNEIEIEVYL